ncbi:hypothetical protein N7489_003441 [Penicillium chrysogenum]|uniref:uncharacterized protein n=1 Tax=Penicillium chrysogenum TaxID=5076 RepID=UPI0024DF2A99|nr:uncharacterized protein N7489_003441 [Penicillium chrysogenum]KAJ5253031.1 hypothetical protein N7489_003441 [Penicillium chrysogenum]
MIISQFRTSPLLLLLPPFSFLAGLQSCGLSVVKYRELTTVFLPNSIKILDSVSSVLDSWLVLVSTIPKPPNTLIPRLALAPPVSRSHTPLPFDCWDPFCDHGDPERPEVK